MATIAALAAVAAFLYLAFRVYRTFAGKRVVTCPETHQPVGVKVNAVLAGATALVADKPRYVITTCTRWPERAGCDQACVPEIATSPEETLVTNIVAEWYRNRPCIYCGRSIREIDGALVLPALRDANGVLREWNEVAPEELPGLLAGASSVCAQCDLTEGLRAQHPELITWRKDTPLRHEHMDVLPASTVVY